MITLRRLAALLALAAISSPGTASANNYPPSETAVEDRQATTTRGLISGFESFPNVTITDAAYIGEDDGNDGFGVDAGMVCDTVSTVAQAGSDIVGVSLRVDIEHTWVGDLVLKLRSPGGQILTVLNRPGFVEGTDDGLEPGLGDGSDWNGNVSFFNDPDDEPPPAEDMGSTIDPSQTICQDDATCQFAPSPGAGTGVDFQDFFSLGAQGIWTLCAGDHAGGDEGTLRGWSLFLTSLENIEADPSSFPMTPTATYIGTGDGNDAFGEDANMVCAPLSTDGRSGGTVVAVVSTGVRASSTFVGDITLKLRSPEGSILGLLSRPGVMEAADDGTGIEGSSYGWSSELLSFVPNSINLAEDIGNGALCPSDVCNFVPTPDSVDGHDTYDEFFLEQASGAWTLCMGDSNSTSSSLDGWNLTLVTIDPNPDLISAANFETGDATEWN